jgi:hypothetical protein
MPLTKKGQQIMRAMKEQYGPERGEQVFYASKNKGTITGVDMTLSDNLAMTRPPSARGPGGEVRTFDPIHDYMDAVGKGTPAPPLVRTR